MSDLDRYASERSEKVAAKESFKPDLFNSLTDSELQRDSTSIRVTNDLANKDLIKNGILGNVTIFDSAGDTKSGAPEKPAQTPDVSPKTTDIVKPVAEPRPGEDKPSDQRQLDRCLRERGSDKPSVRAPEEIKSGDKTAKLEFDKEGKPTKFTDFNGDVIERDKDGNWFRGKPMFDPPQKVEFSVSDKGTITIKYPGENGRPIERSISKEGKDVTTYPEGPSITWRTREGDQEKLTVTNKRGTQTVTLDRDGKVVKFVAPDGTEYERQDKEGKKWLRITKDADGRPANRQHFEGSVKADSDGTVTVRDNSRLGTADANKFATRYSNNGIEITSDDTGRHRRISSPDGLTITDKGHFDDPKRLLSRTFEYPNGDRVELRFRADGTASVTGKLGDQELKLTRDRMGNWSGTINGKEVLSVETEKGLDSFKIKTFDGKTFVINGDGQIKEGVTRVRNLDQRSIVDEMPKDYQTELQRRIEYLEKFANLPLEQRIMLLKKLTEDGGRYDDKQLGRQYQKYGNYAFGMYARALGLPEWIAVGGTKLYKALQDKPSDSKDFDDIRRGMRDYDGFKRRAA